MLKEIEFDILLKNEIGNLAEVCEVLAALDINIRAFALTPMNSSGILQIVVDESNKTRTILKEKGIPFIETAVLTVKSSNKAGSIAKIARKMANAGINVNFAYASGEGEKVMVVFEVEDIDKAISVMK